MMEDGIGSYSAKALLFVLFAVVGKNSVVDSRGEKSGDDSGWLSENMSGLWLVICGDWVLVGSVEKGSVLLPNRPCVR